MPTILADTVVTPGNPIGSQSWWPAWWAGMLTIFFLCALIFLLFLVQKPELHGRIKWRVSLVLMAALVAMLCSMVGLMPDSQKAAADVWGQRGQIAFSFAGPVAVWLVVFLVLVKTLKTEIPPNKTHDQWIEEVEKNLQYVGYDEWLEQKIGSCKDIVSEDNWAFINELLPKAFYRGPKEYKRLVAPVISTLFIYHGTQAVKLQRITCHRHSQEAVHIFDPSSSSTSTGNAKSYVFFRNKQTTTRVKKGRRGAWIPTNDTEIDCLIIATYKNDPTPHGDFVHIDAAKYLPVPEPTETPPAATVHLYIVSDRTINTESAQLWELRSSPCATRMPLAVIFKSLSGNVIKQDTEVLRGAKRSLGEWVEWIKDPHPDIPAEHHKDQELVETLQDVKGILEHYSYLSEQPLATSKSSPSALGFSQQCNSVVVALFTWSLQTPSHSTTDAKSGVTQTTATAASPSITPRKETKAGN